MFVTTTSMNVFAKSDTPSSVLSVEETDKTKADNSTSDENTLTKNAANVATETPMTNVRSTTSTNKVVLKVGELEGDDFVNNTKNYYSAETIPSAVDLDISGKDSIYTDAKLVIKVEKKFYITKPSFATSQFATSSVVTEDDDFYYSTYTFEQLSGGQHFTIPFPFEFNSKTAVKTGDQIKVSATLYAGENETEIVSDEKTYTAQTLELRGESHYYSGAYKYDWDTRTAYVKVLVDNENATKMEDGYSAKIGHVINVYLDQPAGFAGNMGASRNTNIKMVMHLPEYAKLNEDYAGSWQYTDETKSSIYRIINNNGNWPHNERWSDYKSGYCEFMRDLTFSNAPLNKKIPITTEFWIDAGLDTEYKIKDVITSYYIFEPYLYQGNGRTEIVRRSDRNYKPDREIALWESFSYYTNGKNIYYGKYDMASTGMFYYNYVGNVNNGLSAASPYGGIKTNVYEIKTTLREEGEYFTRVFLRDIASNPGNPGILAMQEALKNTPNTLYGIKEDGSQEIIAQNIKTGSYIDILDSSRKYKEIKLVFDSPITLDNANLYFDTYTGLTESELNKFKEGGSFYSGIKDYHSDLSVVFSEGKNPENAEKKTGTYTSPHNYTHVSKVSPIVNEYIQPNLTAVYESGGTPLNFQVGPINMQGAVQTAWGDITHFEYLKTITLLPNGIEYDGQVESHRWKQLGIDEPTIVKNYKGTGKTAVIVDYGKNGVYDYKNVTFKLRATKNTKRGDNNVVTYMVYDHNDIAKPYSENFYYTDALDLDNDGNLNETFMQVHTNINFIPALELILHKDGYFKDENLTAEAVVTDMGDDFVYRLSVFNNAVVPVKYVSLIDIFPYEGDKVIVPNKQGEYKDRDSTFVTGLTGAIEDFEKNDKAKSFFDFFYQTEKKGTIEENRDGVWLTKDQITDFSKVTGFKAVLKEGKEIVSKEEVLIYIPSRMPYDASMNEKTDQSVNTAAFSTNGKEYNEGNSTSVHFMKYEVKGTVYKDKNKDGFYKELIGEQKSGDKSLENIIVNLLNEDGTIAKLPDGKKLTTKTDKDGNYSFNVYTRGKYKVQIENPQNYALVDTKNDPLISAGNSVTAGDDSKSESAVFELNPQTRSSVQNAGYYQDSSTISVEKIWRSSDTVPEATYFFLEKKDGDKWINLNDTYNQGKPFKLSKEKEFRSSLNIAEDLTETDVRVTETTEDGAQKERSKSISIADKTYTVSYTGSKEEGFTITNTLTGKRDVPVNKQWIGNASEAVTIDLLADGKKIDTVILNSTNEWKHTFKNLEKYKNGQLIRYTVKEVGENGNIIKLDTDQYKVIYEGNMTEGITITNEKEIPQTPPTPNKPEVPHTSINKTLPKTGDGSNIFLYAWLMLTSGALLVLIGYRCRKEAK